MYAPGAVPVTFAVDGVRFGCALGIEVHFPEVFTEYERLDVDVILFSTTGAGDDPDATAVFATEAQAHAAANSLWVSFAVSASPGSRPRASSPRTAAGRRAAPTTGTRPWPSPT